MREIKFRAWNENLREMISIDSIEWDLCGVGDDQISGYTNSDWVHKIPTNEVELMQYTGLKDKNGKEIYEGDIVKHIAEIKKDIIIGPVIFKEGCFAIKTKFGDKYLYTGTNEVIGNIYENKYLLGDVK